MTADRTWSGDVIVVGGGPAGSTCATFLSRAGCEVMLIDRGPSTRWQPVEVLAPATVQLLRYHRLFEVDPAHGSQGYGVCRGVHGLWGPEPAFLDYELFACDAAVVVDRTIFDRALLTRAAEAGTHVLTDTMVDRATQGPDGTWIVSWVAADGQAGTASATMLVDAGGRAARSLTPGAATRQYFDRLLGIACPMTLAPSRTQILLLEADVAGWWYSSCDASGHGAAVYLSDADLLPKTAGERESFFRHKFASSRLVRSHLPALRDTRDLDLHVIDARTSRRTCFCAPASLSIGDAAYGVDPLSGSGIRRAVESALAAADTVQLYLATRDPQALDRYEAWATTEFERWLGDKNAVYTDASSDLHNQPFWRRRVTARSA